MKNMENKHKIWGFLSPLLLRMTVSLAKNICFTKGCWLYFFQIFNTVEVLNPGVSIPKKINGLFCVFFCIQTGLMGRQYIIWLKGQYIRYGVQELQCCLKILNMLTSLSKMNQLFDYLLFQNWIIVLCT